ncbi:MAG: hypothetical protein KAR42_06370 [candidate division Zixibacteria bacterium]|nr:hypothetical protein [candidate division Zixibacteria bacterium]
MKIKSRLLRRGVILTTLFLFTMVSLSPAATLQLPKGTDVKVKFTQGMKLSSGTLGQGVPIICHLAEDVRIGDKVVVEAGAQATAVVSDVKKSKGGGKGGYIKISFNELETKGAYNTVDGSKIKLSGYIENTGKGKGFFPYLFFVLFLKGSQGEISTDAVYTVKVAESVILESK